MTDDIVKQKREYRVIVEIKPITFHVVATSHEKAEKMALGKLMQMCWEDPNSIEQLYRDSVAVVDQTYLMKEEE